MDVAAVITAVGGLIGAFLGAIQWQKGRRDTQVQQVAANRVTAREQEHDELVELNRLLSEDVERERRYRREDADRHSEEMTRVRSACAVVQRATTEALVLAKRALRGEIERAAAQAAIDTAARHGAVDPHPTIDD